MAETKTRGTSNRGFASMDPDKQRAIASKGGSSVPPEKRPFAQNHRLAAEAGRKGGENSHGGRKPQAATTAPGPASPPPSPAQE